MRTQNGKTTNTIVTAALLGLCLAGCSRVSTDPSPAFGRVRKNVAERTGHLVQWKTNSDEDAAVEAAVRKLLQAPLTAERTVQIALLNNPRIQADYERLGIAQAQLVQAGLLKNPVFDMSLRFVENTTHDYILEMAVVQDFLDILLVGKRKELARAQLQITEADVTSAVMNLAAQTQMAFVTYVSSLQTYETNRQITEAAELAWEAARRLHDAGNITELALATERALYEQTKLTLAASETQMLQNREALNRWMGLWSPGTDWTTVTALPDLPDDTMPLDQLETQALANSLDLVVARRQMKAVAARTGIDTAELIFPELAGGGEGEREPDGTWSIGPVVSVGIPVFDVGQARTAVGRARMRRLWDEYTALAIDIRTAARRARYRLVNARKQADYYRRVIVPLSEQITAETQLQYNAMQLGVFQLLQAKRMEYDFRRNYIRALENYWLARTELELLLDGHLIRRSAVSLTAGQPGMQEAGGH